MPYGLLGNVPSRLLASLNGSAAQLMIVDLPYALNQSDWHSPVVLVALGAALIAVLASLIAWCQLKIMARHMRAATLLSLDERWESEPLLKVRAELYEIVRKVMHDAGTRWPGLSDGDRRIRIQDDYANELHALRATDPDQYLRVCRICGFFETVGHVSRAGYAPLLDVATLLGGSVQMVGEVFEPGLHPENSANLR
jgi:hypothetical protein